MKHILTILFAFSAYGLLAQDYKLVYYKGDVTIAGQKLAANALIKNDAVVTIGNNTEAIFTNNNKDVVHLNKPGGYTVRNFAAYVKPKSSLSGYYLNYVVNAATHHEADPEKHVTENLKNVGGVSRGRRRFLNFPTVPTKLLDSIITFKWNGSDGDTYKWILMEHTGNNTQTTVAEGEAQGNSLAFDIIKGGGSWGNSYDWVINGVDGQEGGSASVLLPKNEEVDALADTTMQLVINGSALSDGMRFAVVAGYHQERQYYVAADAFYSLALKADPDNEFLKELYANFRKNIYGE